MLRTTYADTHRRIQKAVSELDDADRTLRERINTLSPGQTIRYEKSGYEVEGVVAHTFSWSQSVYVHRNGKRYSVHARYLLP